MKRKHPGGRPTRMTPETIQKLEDAFAIGCPDTEACLYANIARQTLLNYEKRHPEFIDRKERLKNSPTLQARRTVVAALPSDVNTAKWLLEKKDPDLRPATKVEHSGEIEVTDSTQERSPEELKALADLKAARLKRIRERSDKME